MKICSPVCTKNRCNAHEMHTECTRLKGSITIRKEASSRQGAVVFVSNKFIASTRTIWSSGSSQGRLLLLRSD